MRIQRRQPWNGFNVINIISISAEKQRFLLVSLPIWTLLTFPKPLKIIGYWVLIKIIGNLFCTSNGHRCQLHWYMTPFNSSNSPLIFSPNSHKKKTKENDQNITQNRLISMNGMTVCSWNNRKRMTLWFNSKTKTPINTQLIPTES